MAAKKKARTKKKKATRKSFTPEQRAKILAEANDQKLTGKQVAAKHGISMVTYYVWKKNAGGSARRGRRAASGGNGLQTAVRDAVQERVRTILPGVVQTEVARYLDSLFGAPRGRTRRA